MAIRKTAYQKRSPGRISIPGPLKRLRRRTLPISLTILGIAFLAAAATVLWWSRDLPDPQKISSRQIVESTKIYDRTGTQLLYEIGDIRRTAVSLDNVSPYLIQATITTEDNQFYKHHGIDFKGIIRGVIVKPLTGQRAQGGSTITQQLIKNSILTPERTIRRKVKEAVLALELEQKFSKDEILTMYLNEIPYGSQSYGVEAAAQTFFNTSAANVTLAQAALLAALPKAPTYYSPYGSRLEDLKQRQENIIDRMKNLEYINENEAQSAKNEELDFQPRAESISAPHFVFYVKEQLDKEYGERVVEQGGLNVLTTLDMRLQTIAEKTLTANQDRLKSLNASNASLVSVDPSTGDILAMVGSIDYFNDDIDGNVNVAVRHRSPGSSIKPFVYAAAWQKGFTPDTILIDAETDFGQGYRPKNYDLSQSGPVTMRHALANSMNIPAVKTLYLAGIKNATQLAQNMGMTSLDDPDRYGLSLVLGGGDVRLLDEVSAYGVFANDGVKMPQRSILKVSTRAETLFDSNEEEVTGDQIISAELARLVNSVISDNSARSTAFGSNSPLQLGSRPVAAKTGTTQEYRDGWTMGFTPTLAAGVWVGNNDNSPMAKNAAGVATAAPIWNSFMRQALDGTPIEQFVKPQPAPPPPHAIMRGELPEVKGKWEPNANILYANECPVNLGRPATFKEIHNLLFYVRRDNPTGPPPADAEDDPQFSRWKEGVAVWRQKNNEKNKNNPDQPQYVDSLPTPECNITDADNIPRVTIVEPNNTIIRTQPTAVKVDIESEESIKEVRFIFDGQEIARRGESDPYQAALTYPNDFSGRKTLVILAITQNNLVGRASRTFIINPDGAPPKVTLLTPKNGKTFTAASFPLTAKVTAIDDSGIELVDVLYTKDDDNGTKRIGRTRKIVPTAPNRYEVIWDDSPGPGTYTLWAVTYDKTGNPAESSRATVYIE